ncbi:MAG: ribbon-helix-helix protein, CopG family [bacterium]|nr:ribbon-helix-helix protein, CopG family [bacterium]
MAVSEVRTQIYLDHEQHEALKRAAKDRSVSMAQVVREAVAVYLTEEIPLVAGSESDDAYLADPAWQLLEVAEEIGGSGCSDGASRLEDELYGPIER